LSEERMRELRKKWIALYSALMFAIIVAIAFFTLAYMIDQNVPYSYVIIILVPFGFYVGMNLMRLAKLKIPKYRMVKVVKCRKCGYVKVGVPQKGDYVFKEAGTCPRCKGPMYIASIYKEKVS